MDECIIKCNVNDLQFSPFAPVFNMNMNDETGSSIVQKIQYPFFNFFIINVKDNYKINVL